MMLESPLAMVAGAVYTALLVAIARSDARTRRIPNRLVGMLAVAGFLASTLVFPGAVGLAGSLGGFLLGLVLWVPLWFLHVLGAGDVKLAAALGAWLGVGGVVTASVLAALAGGVMAVAVLVHRGAVPRLAADVAYVFSALRIGGVGGGMAARPSPRSHGRTVLPYGIALAAGGLLAAWLPAAQLRWLAW